MTAQGFKIGHAEDVDAGTGCTVVLCPEEGALAAAVVRGMASSTRQMGIVDPFHMVNRVNAVFLAGGSAFGLDAAAGVTAYLGEGGLGFSTPYATIPIVPTAILYDLGVGDPGARPTAEMGYEAARTASAGPVTEGCVGVGTGATVGKLLTVACATKGGVGLASAKADDGLEVSALAAVNAFGDVVDPSRRAIVAGARRSPDSLELIDSCRQIVAGRMRNGWGGGQNTTLVVIMTNAAVSERWLHRVASWGADALPAHLKPSFTAADGDVVVALATEKLEVEPHRLGLVAQEVVGRSLLNAVFAATPAFGLPAASQLVVKNMGPYAP